MAAAPPQAPEVVVPASPDEAVAAFGDGDDVTVFGGGTILSVELAHGRLSPGARSCSSGPAWTACTTRAAGRRSAR